jgi:hypothetical protein
VEQLTFFYTDSCNKILNAPLKMEQLTFFDCFNG